MAKKADQNPQKSNDPLVNLKPQNINLSNIQDPNEKAEADKVVEQWLSNIYEDISVLLEKHDLTIYQLSFLHPGTKNPILLARGDLLQTAILAAAAARQLKTQIDEKIKV